MLKKFLFKCISKKYSKFISKINLKPAEFGLNKNDKALCLCPHADDESIGMGGFLSKFSGNFKVILLTDGRKGVDGVSVEEAVNIRKEEFKNAMKIGGIEKYSFLDIADKKLIDAFSDFQKIDISLYDFIFIPNIIDQHPDHKAVSLLLYELLEKTKYKPNLKICFYEVWSALSLPNGFCDIEDVWENKKDMISSYESQISKKDYVYHILGLNHYRGIFKDKKFVEAFMIMDVNDFKEICKIYQ